MQVGLGLSYAFPIITTLNNLLAHFTEAEKDMVSMERIQQVEWWSPCFRSTLRLSTTIAMHEPKYSANGHWFLFLHGPVPAVYGFRGRTVWWLCGCSLWLASAWRHRVFSGHAVLLAKLAPGSAWSLLQHTNRRAGLIALSLISRRENNAIISRI